MAVHNEITTQDIVDELDARLIMMLLDYVQHPEVLRDILDSTDSVISGSFVLRFIEGRCKWPEGDMDVYVDRFSAQRLRDFFLSEKYKVTSPAPDRQRYRRSTGSIQEVIKMQKEHPRRCVDIIVSSNKSSIYPIAHFWSTHVMNFLTGSEICIAYPCTLDKVGYIVPDRKDEWRLRILKGKYEHRGYVFPETKSSMLGEVRYFGDETCWIMPTKRRRDTVMGGKISSTVVWRL